MPDRPQTQTRQDKNRHKRDGAKNSRGAEDEIGLQGPESVTRHRILS